MKKFKLTSIKTVDVLNAPINLTAIVNSIVCNIRELLGLEKSQSANDSNINQELIPDKDLTLPANGLFSPKFHELIRELIDRKL